MNIEKNKVVQLRYDLEVDGKCLEQVTAEQPLDYIHGFRMLLPRFEAELEGLQEGDSFSFSLSPEEAYGPYEPGKRFDLPMSSFEIDGRVRDDLLVPGRILPMLNSSGDVVRGQVIEVKEDAVTLDFNHEMAGKTLHFTGAVVSVRDATEKELAEGLHGEFLPLEDKGCCGHRHHQDGCCGHHHHEDGCCGNGHHSEHEEGCCGHGHCRHEE